MFHLHPRGYVLRQPSSARADPVTLTSRVQLLAVSVQFQDTTSHRRAQAPVAHPASSAALAIPTLIATRLHHALHAIMPDITSRLQRAGHAQMQHFNVLRGRLITTTTQQRLA